MCYIFQLSNQLLKWLHPKGEKTAASHRRTMRSQKVRSSTGRWEMIQVNRHNEMIKIQPSAESLELSGFKTSMVQWQKMICWNTVTGRQPAVPQEQVWRRAIFKVSCNTFRIKISYQWKMSSPTFYVTAALLLAVLNRCHAGSFRFSSWRFWKRRKNDWHKSR